MKFPLPTFGTKDSGGVPIKKRRLLKNSDEL
jgi:hypothetical protein